MLIPFNRPSMVGREAEYMAATLKWGHISGDGVFSKKCHALMEQSLGVAKTLLTTSCTHALELSALLLNLEPGDQVIFPSFTFVSTINAFVLRGVQPVFVDCRPDTLNIDERLIEQALTPRTKGIVVMHYAGVGCEMDAIQALAKRYNLWIVEDNAHGLFGKYKGKFLGTFGVLATQSFRETKNFMCGEGGALLLNDARFVERAEILREKGTNRSRFFRGQVDKYTWVDVGSSFLPSDLLAGFLYAQLEQREAIQSKRKQIWNTYQAELEGWAEENNVRLPCVPTYCEQAYHMFYLLLPSLEQRQRFIARLREKEILAVFHYLPLHLSPMGKQFGGKEGECPVTEQISDQLVRLPFFYELTEAEQGYVIDAVLEFH